MLIAVHGEGSHCDYKINIQLHSFPLLFPASAVIGVFYEDLFYGLPLPIAFGQCNRGKSKAGKLAIAACATPKEVCTDITLAVARKLISRPTPFLYDDPNDPSVLKDMLISAFGGAETGTAHEVVRPRTIPLITANIFIVQTLAEDEDR